MEYSSNKTVTFLLALKKLWISKETKSEDIKNYIIIIAKLLELDYKSVLSVLFVLMKIFNTIFQTKDKQRNTGA